MGEDKDWFTLKLGVGGFNQMWLDLYNSDIFLFFFLSGYCYCGS